MLDADISRGVWPRQVSPLPQRAQQAGEPPFAGSCLSQPLQQALSPSAVESQAAAHTPACRPLQVWITWTPAPGTALRMPCKQGDAMAAATPV